MKDLDRNLLRSMMHSPVHNYVIPGLTSWLIGEKSPRGVMRLFECSRNQQENITPHSHRFDFQCCVLKGRVTNRIWRHSPWGNAGDQYQQSNLVYRGACGEYERIVIGASTYEYTDFVYEADQWYSMTAKEIHSIYFAKGTEVLFFEGPTITDKSLILQPVVDGDVVPTFEVKPWMFKRASGGDLPSDSAVASDSQ